MKDKYVIVDIYEINRYYKEGYKFLAMFQEIYQNSDYSSNGSKQIHGTLGNDPITLTISDGSTHKKYNSYQNKVLMELTTQAEVLYGEKRENNT